MAQEPDLILQHLRGLDQRLERIETELKGARAGFTTLHEEMGALNRRIDDIEGRLTRIALRLDLGGALR